MIFIMTLISGSGKSSTMYGLGETEPGILRKTVEYLLNNSHSILTLSMVEISGAEIFDLIFEQKKKLTFPNRKFANEMTKKKINNIIQFNHHLKMAISRRIQKPTNQNVNSSRTHAVTFIHLNNDKDQTILFVDLAGFENPNTKDISETKFINSSLSALNFALLQVSKGLTPTFSGSPLLVILKPYIKDLSCKTIMYYHIRIDYFEHCLRYVKDLAASNKAKKRNNDGNRSEKSESKIPRYYS